MEEIFDIVDEENNIISKSTRKEAHDNGLLHKSVFFFILDKQKRVFVNKRSDKKRFYPGFYSILFGGHVSSGQTYEEAVVREVEEEAGIKEKPIFLSDYKKRFDKNDKENVKVYAFITDKELKLDTNEVLHGKFLEFGEIDKMLKKENFLPETEKLYEILKKNLDKITVQ